MSLINEALKKAQRQRTDVTQPVAPAPAPAGNPPVPRIVKRRPPMPARTLMLLLVGGVLVLVMGGVLAFVLLSPDSPAPVVAKATPVHHETPKPQPLPAPTAPAAPAAPATPVATTPTVAAPVQVTPVTVIASTPAPDPSVATIPAITLPVATPEPVVRPHLPVAQPKRVANPAVYVYLDTLRITGVRVSGDDSKVIMNDRIVRLNDYVDRVAGLRLTKVTASSLVFTDDAGFEYTKAL